MSFTTLLVLFMLLLGVLVALIVLWKPGKKPTLPNLSDYVPQVATLQPQVSQRDAALEEEIEIIAAMIRRDEMEKRKEAAVKRLAELKVEKGSA